MSNGDQQNDKPNYYELLCLEPGASKDDVRKAYRKQALLFHPDKMKPHMKEEASQHFQLISEAYDVLFDDKKRELYDRYGYEGVKAGGDPNPQPDLSGFFPPGGHPSQAPWRTQDFEFGFASPFFSSFGVPAGAGGFHGGFSSASSSSPILSTSQQPYSIESVFGGNHATLDDIFSGDQAFFADHQQRHMRNLFDQHMGSMFSGGGGFSRGHGPGFPPDFMHDHGFHQQHHDAFFKSAFGDRDPFQRGEQQQQQQQQRPTLFSTSPFANQTQAQSQSQWSGTGSRSSPFTVFGSNGDRGGGFMSSSSSSSTMGGSGSQTSTRTTIVNGKRTTVTEVTDAQGVTTTTVDNPDGTRETFVNGIPTAIEGRAQPTVLEQGSAGQQPIIIHDDDDHTQGPSNRSRDRGGRSSHTDGGGGSSGGYRLGGRGEGADSSARRASRDRNQYQRTASSAARPEVRTETVFLDDDDDDEILYETLSEHRRSRQQRGSGGREATTGTGTGAGRYAGMTRERGSYFNYDEPDLYHPHMGNGQRLRGSNSPEQSRYNRG